ncbi:hypothetical protein M2475_000377 [Breznakia sp. PF5-3]|uniref:TIM44-like domain-containing protein n=1 Tax=unclassified Breznakia TaxID=2623764 RepID=UPI002406D8BF|nr:MULTISPECIES: TIM44-like domain-containing protein [unclassified Breznakia]MDF9824029.1 hypothetical protein [Breznakia sp. PM6-1]MDF9834828.1 hypothetical protein [Breznakia sp. PF5-3]MDF9838147.1 hypothetical protein [Breznakia sp. PFB2-8]MDF9860133.1 hypothetical protein [Breznakia sp. PH5-24]
MVRGKRIVFVLLTTILFFCSMNDIKAEVGNSGGFDGGSDSGGSGGSSGGWSSGGGSDFSSDGGSGSSSPISILIFAGFWGVSMYVQYTRKKKNDEPYIVNEIDNSAFNKDYYDEESIVEEIRKSDPNFDLLKFKDYVGDLYVMLQKSWEAKDWKQIRLFESDTLFNMHRRQLQEYIDEQKTNYLKYQTVDSVCITEYRKDTSLEILVVRLNAYCVDYITSDVTGALLDGDKEKVNDRSYYLEFIRSIGVQSDPEISPKLTNCPNCGAPLQVSESGECEYCRSVITNGKYGWVLNKYGAWRTARRK